MSKYMENAELVMKFFDKNGWGPYNMLDDGCAARFFGEICGFEGLFKSFHFLLFVGDDVVESYVTYPISAKDKIGIDKLRGDLYKMVAEIHAGRYPFDNFLW